MEPMKPMQPMAPMQPMTGGEAWWPTELGQPSSSGSQNGLRYAFFPEARRLLIEEDGKRRVFDSGPHRISGMSQTGGSRTPVFTSDDGDVDLHSLTPVG